MTTSFQPHELFSKVFQYHLDNFDLLRDKRFHFSARMSLWNGNHFFTDKLLELRSEFLVPNFFHREHTNRLEIQTKFNANRAAQLAKYPTLLTIHDALLQTLYASTMYGENHLAIVKKFFTEEDVLSLSQALLNDKKALAWLSTYSISFLYLVYRFYLKDAVLDLEYLQEIGEKELQSSDVYQLNLQLYYFTHCIIAESLFYSRKIPSEHLETYHQMLQKVESIVIEHFQDLSLDHKFEFLVCCRICDFSTPLFQKIYEEAEKSLSEEGDFFINKMNHYASKKDISFYGREHQNVMYLLSNQEYDPHPMLINTLANA